MQQAGAGGSKKLSPLRVCGIGSRRSVDATRPRFSSQGCLQ
jgi:hypothetical protein